MSNWLKKLLVLLVAVVVVVGAVVFWQWENITAIRLLSTASRDDLAERIDEQQEQTELVLDEYDLTVRDLTSEEEQLVITGELSTEDAISIITGEQPGSVAGTDSTAGDDTVIMPAETQPTSTEIINNYIKQMYIVKADFLGQLAGLYSTAQNEYLALPEEDRTSGAKRSIVLSYAVEASRLEADCNGQVDDLLSELKQELTDISADTDIVTTLRDAYAEEKAVKKAYYLSLIN